MELLSKESKISRYQFGAKKSPERELLRKKVVDYLGHSDQSCIGL